VLDKRRRDAKARRSWRSAARAFVVDVQNGFRNETSNPAVRRIMSLVRDWTTAGLTP
jgi:hypothetical protein